MRFNRRSFFGLIPGAALGGKQAAVALAAEAEKLALGSGGFSPPEGFYPESLSDAVPGEDRGWAARRLAELMDANKRARRWEHTFVTRIDPDLASMRSLSLSAKMAMQKQRDFDREEARTRTYLEGVIAGIFNR